MEYIKDIEFPNGMVIGNSVIYEIGHDQNGDVVIKKQDTESKYISKEDNK